MKDMAATWGKGKVSNPGNLSYRDCVVVSNGSNYEKLREH